jgi:hypothetical protein
MMFAKLRIRRLLHQSTLYTFNSRTRLTTWYFLAFHQQHSRAISEKDHNAMTFSHKEHTIHATLDPTDAAEKDEVS